MSWFTLDIFSVCPVVCEFGGKRCWGCAVARRLWVVSISANGACHYLIRLIEVRGISMPECSSDNSMLGHLTWLGCCILGDMGDMKEWKGE